MRTTLVIALLLGLAACDGSALVDAGVDAGPLPDLGTDAPHDAGRRIDLGVDATLPPLDYTDTTNWLCRPGRTDDCNTHDLTATEIFPDGGTLVEPYDYDAGAPGPAVDCFYVYPTVDISGLPGNHTDLTDLGMIPQALLTEAVRFNGVCRIWAPLYREATLGAFTVDSTPWLDAAYADVKNAWDEYLAHENAGRDFVLVGHSQGSMHLDHLIRDEIDGNAALRAHLVAAVLLGGDVVVPDGAAVGGSFQHVPVCATEAERGCVVQWRTYFASAPPPNDNFFHRFGTVPPGDDVACAGIQPNDAGVALLEGSYMPTQPTFAVGLGVSPPAGITTPFIFYRGLWTARCQREVGGSSYLAITPVPGDSRAQPLSDADPIFSPGILGLHPLDYPIANDDVLRMVRAKIAAGP